MSNKIDKADAEWKAQLTLTQFAVCRQKGTERAFTSEYYDCKEEGVYQCVCCGADLFSSGTKYNSGTGWPSFWESITPEAVSAEVDVSYGMRRVEVLCSQCDAHLGHVFDDGPEPTGQRYCMNSVALKLVKKAGE